MAPKYQQKSVRERILALFFDNIGEVVTSDELREVARDPKTGDDRENWHQRLSELRTDKGYTILSWRDRAGLKPGEYIMPTKDTRDTAGHRLSINSDTWQEVLARANQQCEWKDGGMSCGLAEGESDPVGGGTVKLTPDHKTPHSFKPQVDPKEAGQWQVLCGRHQVMKKNYWDHQTGKLNVRAIVQAASEKEKREAYKFLKEYFGEGA